jgi:ABC-2 type transport system ATP-binding protein
VEILKATNVSKTYANHIALDDISITIPSQCIFGLLGPNGAGKTTLIRIITQIIAPDTGNIFFNGQRLTSDHIGMIGYLPEERGLYKKMKVGEQLLYLSQLKGLSKQEAVKRIKLWFEKFEIGSWWNKHIEDLSKGMQQKIQFIATVLHEPKLIILDEPFSGFDPINANLIKDEIIELKEKGATIIFSTHRMETVEQLCDYIALINKSKKILDGSKKEIKDAYKSNTYIIEHKGLFGGLSESFSVLQQEKLEEDQYMTTIKINENLASSNQLLAEMINKVEISAFRELIPSFNDIFIAKVKEVEYA